jgi:hypothetical protein
MNSIDKSNHTQLITVVAHTLTLLAGVLALSFLVAIVESFPS